MSFSKHASTDKSIVIKHHPIDRGRVDYSKFIADLSQELNIANRVKVVHDVYLLTLLKNAIGTITINSILDCHPCITKHLLFAWIELCII